MEKLVRYSTFDIRVSNGEVSSIFDIRYSIFKMEKLVRYSTFDIRYSEEKLVRYSIFDIRTAAVDHLITVKTFFGNRKVTEYQVFNIKTNF